jgi:hypothetical protein
VLGVFALLAFVTLLSETLGNLLSVVGQAIAVTLAYGALDAAPEADNSFGVRVLLSLVAGLAAGVVVLLGFVFLVVPGIFLAVRLRLVVASVMLEDSGPLEALSRSFELTADHGRTVFGVWFVTTLAGLAVVGGTVVALDGITPAGGVDFDALRGSLAVAGAAATLVVSPLVAATDAVMFGLYGPDRLGADDPPDA